MTWVQFATAVLGGTVGALLTQLATFFRDWWNKREEGRFEALTLALALEAYASNCSEPYFSLSNYVSSKYATEEPSGSVPSLPEFSEKTNWRSLGVKAASDVLGFRVRVNTAHGALSNTWEFDGKAVAWDEAADTGIELGAAALRIARGMRARFRLGRMPKQGHFDPEQFFAERLSDLESRRADREKNAVDLLSDMTPAQTA
jgi:hypothetical protein